jgi:hypothetical protein
MHAQREHAQFLVTEKNAHCILAVKNNQPGLHAQLASLPWHQVPAGFDAREKGHGRDEWRTLKVTAIAAGIAFPHAAQAIQIKRRRKPLTSTKRWSAETSYAVTSLAAHQAAPAQLAAWVRGHWRIEPCTMSATSPTARTPPRSTPATGPKPWPPCATWRSASSNSPVTPASPLPAATTPATPTAS